jgi:peptidoglycan hydrolase-like protein with peptidoglycan-binding domain
MRRYLLTSAALAVMAGATWADDAALLLGNDSYERLGPVARAADVLDAANGLEALGFNVTALRNGRVDTTATSLAEFAAATVEADRIVVVLSGRFVTDGHRTWLLTADAVEPSYLRLGSTAVSLDSVMTVMAGAAGEAVLLLGADTEAAQYDAWLSVGIGELSIPQGVTVLSGSVRDVASFAETVLTQPQEDIVPYFEDYGLTASGYTPRSHVIMPMRPSVVPVPQTPQVADTGADDALWEGAQALDSADAYRNYIRRFPNGKHIADAERLINEIMTEPNRQDRLIEEALDLSRDARREIQRDLSLLDYNTRGIDGIFGTGTRQAITNWQQENGYSQSSYLTQDQIARLDAQAARRSAELDAEAERRRREAELLDRTYWDETGSVGDEPGLRAYLDRYPDGVFAELATDRLAAIQDEKRRAAEAAETAAWDRASGVDAVGAYQEYLSVYPEGEFVGEAQARIADLTEEQEIAPEIEAAQAAEAALELNALTRRLVELRLGQMGLSPGVIDGTFDDDTRRAIRRYQTNSEVEGIGYLNEATLVRLLADAVGNLGR